MQARGLSAQYHVARLLNRINQSTGWDGVAGGNWMVKRVRDQPVIATERVSLKPKPGGAGVKANQAWKYPGGNIVRADSCEINGRFYSDHKDLTTATGDLKGKQGERIDTMQGAIEGTPRRKQESNFLITINPNQKYSETDEPIAKSAFQGALRMLQSSGVFVRLLKFGPKNDWYLKDHARDVVLPGVNWTASVEIGENHGKMHCHIWCTIEHYSQIQINIPMLRHEFNTAFNSGVPDNLKLKDLPYTDVKLLPQSDWTMVMRQYIQKGMNS